MRTLCLLSRASRSPLRGLPLPSRLASPALFSTGVPHSASAAPHSAPAASADARKDGVPTAAEAPMDVRLPPAVVASLAKNGVRSLMPIQAATLAVQRSGVDVVARAKTGSGKTLAFLLPVMEKLCDPNRKRGPGKGPMALVIEPTRELALQVARVVDMFGTGTRPAVIYGGASEMLQRKDLMRNPDIVVATPGRLCDFIRRGVIDLKRVEVYVIDEADRLLDMGFEDDLRLIGDSMGPDRQTIMFSATLPDWTVNLAKTQLKRNMQLIDLVRDEKSAVPEQVRHIAATIDPARRHLGIRAAMEKFGKGKALVFGATKYDVDEIASYLPNSRALHGGHAQTQRERRLADFRRGICHTLVATDVASRGLDISDVTMVIQVRPKMSSNRQPLSTEDYIHRAGRVGRAGQEGVSIILHERRESRAVDVLERETGAKFERIDLSQVEGEDPQQVSQVNDSDDGGGNARRGGGSSWQGRGGGGGRYGGNTGGGGRGGDGGGGGGGFRQRAGGSGGFGSRDFAGGRESFQRKGPSRASSDPFSSWKDSAGGSGEGEGGRSSGGRYGGGNKRY